MKEMTSEEAERLFRKCGAVLDGHFLLTSGLHSPVYWEKFRILEHPDFTQRLCSMIAQRFAGERVEAVAGPTTGGIILAYEVARQLGVPAVYAEKEGEKRSFRRGFVPEPGERILVVDDVLTTGKSVREVLDAVTGLGGNVVGIGVLVDRSEQDLKFGYPLFSCLRAAAITHKPEGCPLCVQGLPLVKLGSSKQTA